MLEADAATFARQHDPDAAMLDVDDAIERLEAADLIRASGTPTQLRITLRGQAFLQALHEGRHDPEAYVRARRLFGGQVRPNPSQASFSWAGDPRQLTMSFDAPPTSREPEASPGARSAFGRSSAAQLRTPKPKRATKPKAEPKPRKPRSPYGAPIKLDSEGEPDRKAFKAWCVRYAMNGGPAPGMDWDAGSGHGSARDRLHWWVKAWQSQPDREAEQWRRFLDIYRMERKPGSTFEQCLKVEWCDRARYQDARNAAVHAGLLSVDEPAFLALREAIKRSDKAPPASADAAYAATDRAWLALLNRWLDVPWSPPKRNPAASTELRSTRGKTETRRAREAAQAEIRRQRAEQKRARADRKAELDQARGQTKRIREKVTAASRGRRERIRTRAWERIDRANARIAEMRAQKAWTTGKAPKAGHGRVWEQNEEVEREIKALDPMLVPLWRSNRVQFKGTAHERFERFLEWADEQGEGTVWDAIEKTLPTDRQLAADYEAWASEQATA